MKKHCSFHMPFISQSQLIIAECKPPIKVFQNFFKEILRVKFICLDSTQKMHSNMPSIGTVVLMMAIRFFEKILQFSFMKFVVVM